MRRIWHALRRLVRRSEPPIEPPWPDDEPAIVRLRPRRPHSSAAVVLEPPADPDPLEYPTETDAVGPVVPPDDEDEAGGLRAAAN